MSDVATRPTSDQQRIDSLVSAGHSYHCGCRLVWGDGECECGQAEVDAEEDERERAEEEERERQFEESVSRRDELR